MTPPPRRTVRTRNQPRVPLDVEFGEYQDLLNQGLILEDLGPTEEAPAAPETSAKSTPRPPRNERS